MTVASYHTGVPERHFNTTDPQLDRIWNYLQQGKDNYPADRALADELLALFPWLVTVAVHHQAFRARSTRFLAEQGIRQFLVVGTGIPVKDPVHEVAESVNPGSAVVYVDDDVLVLTYARALLTPGPDGECEYIEAEPLDVDSILAGARTALDFNKPVAVMLNSLHDIPDDGDAAAVVERIIGAVPSGSAVTVTHPSTTQPSHGMKELLSQYALATGNLLTPRTPQQITTMLNGLDLLDPGVSAVSTWRPGLHPWGDQPAVEMLCAAGTKP